MNFRHSFDSRGCLKFRLEKSVYNGCISRDTFLRELNVIIKPNRLVLLCTKRRVLERNLCVIVSTFLIFMFAEQLIFVDVFSQLQSLIPKNNNGGLPL